MTYQFATEDLDYSDYSGGRVIYSQPGFPAFPVRLASEIFQRAGALLQLNRPLAIYDPTCGGAYHLAALGFLHGEQIAAIYASDANQAALELARRNLNLLTHAGLGERAAAIQAMLEQYGKPSHAEALRSAGVLRERLESILAGHVITLHTFQANVMDDQAVQAGLSGAQIDLIISDVPYGHLTGWHIPQEAASAGRSTDEKASSTSSLRASSSRVETASAERAPLWRALDGLLPALSAHTLVAIAADKSQKITHEGYRRVERFQVGKRQVTFLQPLAGHSSITQ